MSGKSRKARRKKYALPPSTTGGSVMGTLVMDPGALPPRITLLAYGPDQLVERTLTKPRELHDYLGKYPVMWVNVEGLGNGQVIFEIGNIFGLHPLAMDDVAHVHQRAKVEDYHGHTFIVTRMVEYEQRLQTEQMSLFLGRNFVITFQERPGKDCIAPVYDRLRRSTGRLRAAGADYLAYTLLDAVVDGYFPVLEQYAERLEDLEDRLAAGADRQAVGEIHAIKSELLIIRRALWPHREAFHTLVRDPNPLIHDETRIYLRDCYDHTVQLFELVETYRELGADLRDLYLSSASFKMNEIIKVLTITSTIFIPLTFIAGVYGMNFHHESSPWNMPELDWYWGYPLVLLLMVLVTMAMLLFFWRRGWMGSVEKPYTGNGTTNNANDSPANSPTLSPTNPDPDRPPLSGQ